MVRFFVPCLFCLCLGAQVVQESFQRDPGPLDFIRGEGFEQRILQSLTGDSLVGVDAEGNPVPRLARSWRIEGRRIRFDLRRDAQFQDGSPVRAEDIVWTFQTIQRMPDASPSAKAILEKVEVQGRGDQVELLSPKPPGRLLLELPALCIAKQECPGTGSGPFVLKKTSGEWRLRARAHFLNPRIQGFCFRLLPDGQALLQNLQKGWLSLGTPPDRPGLTPPASHLELRQPMHAQAIAWSRAGSEPLKHLEVWRTVAFPQGALGPRVQASRGLWPESLGFPPKAMGGGPRPDPRGKRWELLYGAGDEALQRALMAIRSAAQREGAELELKPLDPGLLYDRLLKGDYELACAVNVFEPHPWSVLDLMDSAGALNFSHWSQPRYGEIAAKLESPRDPAWETLQELWAQGPTSLPLVDFTSLLWVDRRLHLTPSSRGIYLSTPGAAGWAWKP